MQEVKRHETTNKRMANKGGFAGLVDKAKGKELNTRDARATKRSTSKVESESKLLNLLQVLVEAINPAHKQAAVEAFAELKESLDEDEKERGTAKAKIETLSAENDAVLKAMSNQEKKMRDMERSFKDVLCSEKTEREEIVRQVQEVGKGLTEEKNEREAIEKKVEAVGKGLVDVEKAYKENGAGAAGGQRSSNDMKRHEIRAEKREREGNVIVRGVPYSGPNETQQECYAQVYAMLNTMLKPDDPPWRIRFIKRLVNRKKPAPPGAKPPPVLVAFEGLEEKKALFMALPSWGRVAGNEIYKFANDVLPSLKKEHDAMEKMAYDLRQATRGLKTRVILQDTTYVLMTKRQGEDRFSPEKAAGADAPAEIAAGADAPT